MLLLFASELGYYLTTEVCPYCCHGISAKHVLLGHPRIVCGHNSRREASDKLGRYSLSYSVFL